MAFETADPFNSKLNGQTIIFAIWVHPALLPDAKAAADRVSPLYHVMARGNRRAAIVLDEDDRRMLLPTLGEMAGRTEVRVHAYAVMDNHYHFVLETPKGNLVAAMRWYQTAYTMRFNAKKLRGHLFGGALQGRWWCRTVRERETRLLHERGNFVFGYDQSLAAKVLEHGLRVLELSADELGSLRKGDWRKALLANVLCENTCVKQAWIAEKLEMGAKPYVSRLAGRWGGWRWRTKSWEDQWRRLQK